MIKKDTLFIEKEGLKLHHKISGQGQAVILLNSAFADMRIWESVASELSRNYQVIQVDFRYSGKTEQDVSDYFMFEDLDCLVEELGLDKVVLVGLSAGGYTALEYASKYPEKVNKLLLISTGLFGLEEDPKKVARMESFQSALYSGDIEKASTIWTKMWLLGEARKETDLDMDQVILFKDITKYNLMKGLDFKMPRFLEPPVNASLTTLEMEVIHILGSLDYQDVHYSNAVFKEQVKDYKEIILEAAHMIPLEQPQFVVQTIAELIG